MVWIRGQTATEECPKSLMTPQSLEWLEKFFVWKFSGGRNLLQMPARDADALLILEQEWRKGANDGRQKSAD